MLKALLLKLASSRLSGLLAFIHKVSGVFRTIDPQHCIQPASVSSPASKAGVHIRRAVSGWEVNILEDVRHWIGLLKYNPSTSLPVWYPTREKKD
jgi:hypothetical protein